MHDTQYNPYGPANGVQQGSLGTYAAPNNLGFVPAQAVAASSWEVAPAPPAALTGLGLQGSLFPVPGPKRQEEKRFQITAGVLLALLVAVSVFAVSSHSKVASLQNSLANSQAQAKQTTDQLAQATQQIDQIKTEVTPIAACAQSAAQLVAVLRESGSTSDAVNAAVNKMATACSGVGQ